MPIETKPEIKDVVIRVRLKTEIFGISKYDDVPELVEQARKVCDQIKRHCDDVYDASVCAETDGPLAELGEWNNSEWA